MTHAKVYSDRLAAKRNRGTESQRGGAALPVPCRSHRGRRRELTILDVRSDFGPVITRTYNGVGSQKRDHFGRRRELTILDVYYGVWQVLPVVF